MMTLDCILCCDGVGWSPVLLFPHKSKNMTFILGTALVLLIEDGWRFSEE